MYLMRSGRKILLSAGLLLCLQLVSGAQEKAVHGIPADVYYLMPSFGQGLIYFRGQAPAQGKLNICAVDNTLRFIDKSGKELEATQADNILRVRIDTVTFIRYQDVFYRMYPVSPEMGVALKRDVRIHRDTKQGAYGTTSQTSSISEYATIYADGMIYNLDTDKVYPYDVSETPFLYKGETVFPLTRKNLKKLFPGKKEDIEAYFKAGNAVPESVDEALALLTLWAQ